MSRRWVRLPDTDARRGWWQYEEAPDLLGERQALAQARKAANGRCPVYVHGEYKNTYSGIDVAKKAAVALLDLYENPAR